MSDEAQAADVSVHVDTNAFFQQFFNAFVRNGYGAMPKREIDLHVLDLLLTHSSKWSKEAPPHFELARTLRLSPRRLRTLLDDLAYRDGERDDEWCREQLREILKSAEIIKSEEWVAVQIDDGLIRDFATAAVRREFGIVDTSFNSAIVKLSGSKFAALALNVLAEKERAEVLATIDKNILNAQQDEKQTKSAIRLFIDAFAAGAGEEAGKQSVSLGFALLTGGMNQVGKIIGKFVGADTD